MKTLFKLKENQNVFIVNNIYDFIDPLYIYVPLLKEKSPINYNYVYKNTYFGEYIASTSGKIKKECVKTFDNKKLPCLCIQNDLKENTNIKTRKKKINNLDDLLNILTLYHLPNIRENITNMLKITNLIVTSFDEEIYSMNEFMNLTKNYGEILLTIDKLREVFNLDKAYLAIKNTNYKSIRNVKSIIGIYPNIEIVLLPDKYLIKEKNNLCAYLNKEEETTLVINTKDVYNIYEALNGKYISEVLITISGDAIKKSLIINTKIGVSLKELMAKFIELTTDDYDIYLNGYLRGRKISSNEDIIITHKTECIVINKRSDNEVSECINCGACMRICPKNINVLKCFLEGKSHKRCINCGLCNFICPANLALKEVLIGDKDEKENN